MLACDASTMSLDVFEQELVGYGTELFENDAPLLARIFHAQAHLYVAVGHMSVPARVEQGFLARAQLTCRF